MKNKDILQGIFNGNTDAKKAFKEKAYRPQLVPLELMNEQEEELYSDLIGFHLFDTNLEGVSSGYAHFVVTSRLSNS